METPGFRPVQVPAGEVVALISSSEDHDNFRKKSLLEKLENYLAVENLFGKSCAEVLDDMIDSVEELIKLRVPTKRIVQAMEDGLIYRQAVDLSTCSKLELLITIFLVLVLK